MIGFDICRLLSLQSAVYENLVGLFNVNEVPNQIDCNKFAIIHDSNHWAVIHNNLFNQIEVFDSLGSSSPICNKLKSNQIISRSFVFNTSQLQSDESSLCGQFVIFYIIKRFFDDDICFSTFLNHYFSSNHKRNGDKVEKFIENLKNGRL